MTVIEPDRPARHLWRIVRAGRLLWQIASDRAFRQALWLGWTRPSGLFQPFNDTFEDRYPRIFACVRAELGPLDGDFAILSFGCSTGEEVFTLRRYFPAARLTGLDINAANIAVCASRPAAQGDAAMRFAVASSTSGEADGAYDAIFCMAVLRHGSLSGRHVKRCDHLLRFEDFERAVADFSRCLKRGGLLAMARSHFRFSDTRAAADFETLMSVSSPEAHYGPDHNRLPDAGEPVGAVFRKLR